MGGREPIMFSFMEEEGVEESRIVRVGKVVRL